MNQTDSHMNNVHKSGLLVVGLFGGALVLWPQVKQSSSDSSTVIRATTHLVQLDVVVTDSSAQPLKNALTEKDFTILEDGQPQKVSFFSYQQFDTQEKTRPAPPQLPAHVTTNRPEYRRIVGPPVILLLDGINTPVENLIDVRQRMLKFMAEHFDPHMRIAVFLLGNELTVLQDFTSDPTLLTAALQKYRSQGSAAGRMGGTDVQLQPPSFDGANLPPQAAASAGAGSGLDSNGRSLMNIGYALARFEKESNASTMEMRVAHTADALSSIARYLAGFPGRKVVVWFSASFPLNLSVVDPEDFDVYRSYADRIRATTNLLSDAQVAIYPVDARGLTGNLISDASYNDGMQLTVDAHMKANSKEVFERFNKEDSLTKVAQETGGRVFLNTNDFDRAIVDSIRDSSNFYEIGYYPIHKKWDGKFHTIKVKVAGNGLTVRHRRGYYAIEPESWRRAGAKEMNLALEKNTVTSTGVLFYARAMPPPANGEVKVEFLVDAHTITFETMSENQRYCNLEFQVQAFSPEDKLVKAEVQQAEAPLKPETFDRIRQSGLPMPVSIKLVPGQYVLHLGVRDNRTGQFGTSELPVTVGDAQAQ